ncbi:MAG: DUF4350 domain-containing protein [Myxococcaceae bacterium]|nr:DUF4350 domain-containing protein [Myxococcaceae bacterium]
MKKWQLYALYAVLLVGALALGLAAGGAPPELAIPSVGNPTPPGIEVLKTYLTERGHHVEVAKQLPEVLPPNVSTWVIAAPQGHAYSEQETQRLLDFAGAGGRLLYLAPRSASAQEPLNKALGVKQSHDWLPPPGLADVGDAAGASVEIAVPVGPLAGLTSLRVSQRPLLSLTADDAVPLTRPAALWVRRVGEGEVWVAAGADLAENKRLDLADNVAFWEQLAREGLLVFDESHQLAREHSSTGRNIYAFGAQLFLVGLAWAYARGKRMAPARSRQRDHHRSSTDYIESMAQLLKRARVDSGLMTELSDTTRRALTEALGTLPQLPVADLARAFEQRTGQGAAQVSAFFDFIEAHRQSADSETYWEASRQAATLEAFARGRRPQS